MWSQYAMAQREMARVLSVRGSPQVVRCGRAAFDVVAPPTEWLECRPITRDVLYRGPRGGYVCDVMLNDAQTD